MPIRVQLPDGSIGEFPDGMKESDIEAVLQKQYGPPSNRPAGLPAGVDLPGVTAHPAVNMQSPAPTLGNMIVNRVGQNVRGLVAPLEHPIQSILSYPRVTEAAGESDDLISDIRQNPNRQGIANALGDTLTAAAIGGAMHAAPWIAAPLGERLQSAGAELIDNTVGLRKGDTARGAEPGRAYLEGGGGPALSMKGIAKQARNIKNQIGQKLGEAYRNSSAIIPAADVEAAVRGPISNLRNLQNAPGGLGASPSLTAFEDNLMAPVNSAANRGGFTPSELFSEMKRPISENTRWNDPSMYDLNKVRQETVGNIGDILTNAVPETRPLNKIYQGTSKLAARAEERAATGQSPISGIGRRVIEGAIGMGLGREFGNPYLSFIPLVADTVPVKTTVAKGLFEGGRISPSLGRGIGSIAPLAGSRVATRPKPSPENTQDR